MSILDILQKKKIITAEEAAQIEEQALSEDRSLKSILLEKGVPPTEITEGLSEFFGIPVRHLKEEKTSPEDLRYIPEESAVHYKIVPLGVRDGVLEVGIVDPDNIDARDALNFISSRTGLPFKLFLISEPEFESVLSVYRSFSEEITKSLEQLGDENSGVSIESDVSDIGSDEERPKAKTKKDAK